MAKEMEDYPFKAILNGLEVSYAIRNLQIVFHEGQRECAMELADAPGEMHIDFERPGHTRLWIRALTNKRRRIS